MGVIALPNGGEHVCLVLNHETEEEKNLDSLDQEEIGVSDMSFFNSTIFLNIFNPAQATASWAYCMHELLLSLME